MSAIKKVITPVMALITATVLTFGLSAFKTNKPLTTTTMYYQAGTFNQGDVQNKSNWNTVTQNCPSGTVKACQVTVPSAIVSGGSFISSVSLTASSGSPSVLTNVKNSGSDVDVTIQNKPN